MKRMLFLAVSIIVLWTVCLPASGQKLKPLKSFCGNETEYLKGNFENENTSFNGRSFGDLMNAVEAKLLTARINYEQGNSSLFIYLYLQDPDYVDNTARLKEWYLTGIAVLFEENSILKEATGKVFEIFPQKPATVLLTKENMDKLIYLLKEAKIRRVLFKYVKMRTVGGPE